MNLSTGTMFKNLNTSGDDYIHLEGELLRKVQLTLASMMDDVAYVCDKYRITWLLSGGSVLGAVRHGGFIPWDDDMDILLCGKDRRKFYRCMRKEFGDRYAIQTERTPGYGLTVSRVRLKDSIFRVNFDTESKECGFFIDIFWIENVPDNKALRSVHGFCCLASGLLLSCRTFFKNRETMKKIMKDNPEVRKTFRIKIVIGSMIRWIPLEKLCTFTQALYGASRNEHSACVTVPCGRLHYFKEMLPREVMFPPQKLEFEGRMWNVPHDTDSYLKNLYGDYMTVPPESERETHALMELKFPGEQ